MQANPCEAAKKLGEIGCTAGCTACIEDAAGCATTSTATRTSTTTFTTTLHPCDRHCVQGGANSTCRQRISWVGRHRTLTSGNPCVEAVTMVATDCPGDCDACTAWRAG